MGILTTGHTSLAVNLDRLWRLLATALSFSLFGLGGLLLALLLFPMLNLFVRERPRRTRIAQRIINRAFAIFIWFMDTIRLIDADCTGGDLLSNDTGCLIVANHPSLIDVVLIMAMTPRMQCVVKHQNWRNPFMRGALMAAGYVRNDEEPERLVAACVERLQAGDNLLIFPEGSRTTPGERRKFQRGFANIALAANAPIRLVSVVVSPTTLTRGEKWYSIPPRRPCFRVRVHEKFAPAQIVTTSSRGHANRQLTRFLAQRFEDILAHERTRDEDLTADHRQPQLGGDLTRGYRPGGAPVR